MRGAITNKGDTMRSTTKDHDAIIEAINASPHKCIDKEIGKQFNCSYRLVLKLRYAYCPHIMFHKKKNRPRPVHKVMIETNRINYLQKEIIDLPYRLAQASLKKRGYYLSLDQVKEMAQ